MTRVVCGLPSTPGSSGLIHTERSKCVAEAVQPRDAGRGRGARAGRCCRTPRAARPGASRRRRRGELPAVVEPAQHVAGRDRVGAQHARASCRRDRRRSCGSSTAWKSRRPRSSCSAVSSWLTGSKYGSIVPPTSISRSRRTSLRRGGAEDQLDLAGVPAGLVDRLVEVELGLRARCASAGAAGAARRASGARRARRRCGSRGSAAPRRPSSPSGSWPGRRRGCRSDAGRRGRRASGRRCRPSDRRRRGARSASARRLEEAAHELVGR